MTRGVQWCVLGALALVTLAGCGRSWFETREPWRREAEEQCLKSGAVREGPAVAMLRPIQGPGACGADFPLKVAALGEAAAMRYDDEPLRPPGAIPQGMPVLIDEAYHHFVDDPRYATSVPYVLEGRPVIIARTFSKIAALAGMRLGYAVAPAELIQKMRPYSMGSINALVKWGGVASLKDEAGQKEVKARVIALRKKTTQELEAYGYECIPSETNFFMVHIGREIQPVIQEFAAKKVAVGRPFPPMTTHMRVSVGTDEEMARFTKAFKEIFPAKGKSTAAGA